MTKIVKKTAVLTEADVQKVPEELRIFNMAQLKLIMERTPKHQIKTRKAKGGGTWDYVNGAYCIKMLNMVFAFNWDFKIIDKQFDLDIGQCFVLGRLSVRVGGTTIEKEQFGRADIKFRTAWENNKKVTTKQPLDIGNDLKAASTDAMKKCASQLGFFSDVYYADDFKNLEIVTEDDKQQKAIDKRCKTLEFHLSKCNTLEEVERIEQNYIESYHGDLYKEEIQIIKNNKTRINEL